MTPTNLIELAERVRSAMEREYQYAAAREKEAPDNAFAEGYAEGMCDMLNRVNEVFDRALRTRASIDAPSQGDQK